MEQSQNSSRRMIYIGIALVVIVIVVIAAVAFAVLGTTKKEAVTKSKPTAVLVTVGDVQQSLAVLDSTLTKASADAAVANTTVSKATTPMTIGN